MGILLQHSPLLKYATMCRISCSYKYVSRLSYLLAEDIPEDEATTVKLLEPELVAVE